MMENMAATEENGREESRRLDLLDEVSDSELVYHSPSTHSVYQLHRAWSKLPTEDIQEWTIQIAETIPAES